MEEFPPLSPSQSRFVEEYLIDPTNGAAAAIRAGYSIHSAKHAAHALKSLPKVRAAIEEGQKERAEKMGITQERVLQEIALIAFANLKDIVTKNAEGDTDVDMNALDRSHAAALAEVSISTKGGRTKTRTAKVRLADKISALDKLGKHLGMFKDKVEVTGTLTLEQLVQRSMDEKSEEPEVKEVETDTPTDATSSG